MPRLVPAEKRQAYMKARGDGMGSIKVCAEYAGVTYEWAKTFEKKMWPSTPPTKLGIAGEPIPLHKLNKDATRALNNLGYFARRYFGLIPLPWEERATEKIVELLATPVTEYTVINIAPTAGKSTFFTYVLPAWLTVRNRSIRGIIASNTNKTATWYTNRLRSAFSRFYPIPARADDLALGISVDAQSTLLADYGKFKPDLGEDIWRPDQFSVLQHRDIASMEKEPTWQSFGKDAEFLGARVNIFIADDAYTPKQNKTEDAKADTRRWWSTECETRVEEGGLVILQGQRLAPDDIYRYALDMTFGESDDDQQPKYHHIKFKAHYDELCIGNHAPDSPPWPDGCLLSPRRLNWRALQLAKSSLTTQYEIVYQQEDIDPTSVLVPRTWIDGGLDVDGAQRPGCLDKDRHILELPKGLKPPLYSYATVDPSAENYWAMQWFVYCPANGYRYLMDAWRGKMEGNEFLEWLEDSNRFRGIAHDWQLRSIKLGHPIRTWIVERNGVQKWLIGYNFVQRWKQQFQVDIIPHTTHVNKLDEKMGVPMLRPLYYEGLVRLPAADLTARSTSDHLIREVTRWRPDNPGGTSDQVMAQWFGEAHLPNLMSLSQHRPNLWRPTWMLSDAEQAAYEQEDKMKSAANA